MAVMAVKLPGLFSKTRFCEKIWKAVCSRGKKREDMEDRKSTAKAEYEAELYRQTHPYEQWIAENEKENRGDGPRGFLLLAADEFCCMLDGYKKEADGTPLLPEGTESVLIVSDRGEVDPRAYDVIRQAFRDHPDTDVIYADEDVIGREGRRCDPWFKPDWSPDTFMSFFYFEDLLAFRGTHIEKAVCEGIPAHLKGRGFRDLTSYLIGISGDRPLHIPEVLLHMKAGDAEEDISQKIREREKKELSHPYYPIEIDGRVAKVSVIIPSKDHPDLLERCLGSLREYTEYKDYEIIVVDNGSNDENRAVIETLREKYDFTYLYDKEDFNFSRMCNRGAAKASGDLLLFLNDDIEVRGQSPKWMRVMAGHALQKRVGAVGAKLWYPKQEGEDRKEPMRIQHCGITNIALGPVHKMGGMHDTGNIYHMRNRATADVLAVTAACLMIKREKYDTVGGFDEELAVAYNDVDLCFSLYEKGLYNVVRADAVLIHHESASRGSDMSPEKRRRQEAELEKLYGKHPALYGKDPFYSPHLVQERLDVEFHLGYAYPYEKAGIHSEIREITPEDYAIGPQGRVWRKLGLDLQILQHVDDVIRRVRFTADGSRTVEYRIEGWAAPAKRKAYLYERQLLLVREDGSGYRISLFDKYRTDTGAILAEQEAWELAGFVARIPEGAVADGSYRILLSFAPKKGGKAFVTDTQKQIGSAQGEFTLRDIPEPPSGAS